MSRKAKPADAGIGGNAPDAVLKEIDRKKQDKKFGKGGDATGD
jgi:hypothetical protein